MIENFDIFQKWEPVDYLTEYFPPNVDAEPAVRFIVEESRKLTVDNPIGIDIGCGPTVCYWSALAKNVSALYLAEYLDRNRQQQKLWIDADPKAFDWSYYTRLILDYEGHKGVKQEDILAREQLSRSKVRQMYTCDLSIADPIGVEHRGRYDCVVSCCCADSITTNKSDWFRYMQNIFSLLKPGGLFIGSSMWKCTHYDIGDMVYPAANIDEDDFEELFRKSNFDTDTLRIEVTDESRPLEKTGNGVDLRDEYDKIILASAFLRK